MNIKVEYDEETTEKLNEYTGLLREYEDNLRGLIAQRAYLGQRDKSAYFYEDTGRYKLIKIIENIRIKGTVKNITIIERDKL